MKGTTTVSALEWLIIKAPLLFEDISHREQIPNKNPEMQQQLHKLKMETRNTCINSFKECLETGIFILSIHYETIASIYIEEIKSLEPKFRTAMIYLFLNGLCSAKGRNELTTIYSTITQREIK